MNRSRITVVLRDDTTLGTNGNSTSYGLDSTLNLATLRGESFFRIEDLLVPIVDIKFIRVEEKVEDK